MAGCGGSRRRRGTLRRMLAPRRLAGVRGRVALLLLVAAIPLLLLAIVIVWQNSRLLAEAPLERVAIVRAGAAERVRAILDEAQRFVAGMAADPDLDTVSVPACDLLLRRALALQPARFAALAVLDGTGAVRCAAQPDRIGAAVAAPWWRTLREGQAAAITVLDDTHGRTLVVGAARRAGRGFAGAVVGEVAAGPLSGTAELPTSFVWLADLDDGTVRLLRLRRAPGGQLPKPVLLAHLLAATIHPILVAAAGGEVVALAAAPLDGGLRLLVGTPATRDLAMARRALLLRVLGLVVLLGAGLAAVAVGANVTLVKPIKRLARAVEAWRGGAPFDPGPRRGVPLELRQLAASFVEATRTLAERERDLQRAVEQQELAMQEIHHRVKNNLQIIASLLNLQASRIRLPEAKREFAAARDRIRALATLHRHLYAHGDLHTINMRSFLHELCDQLLAAMGETPGGRIQLTIEAPALQISSDQAVPMALIVTEAVSNSAKYAFPGGRGGHIRVVLTTQDDHARLVIEDDGVGLPEAPGETETGVRDGIGLHLIRGFARQLGGRFVLTQAHGTRYELDVRLRREPAADRADAPPLV